MPKKKAAANVPQPAPKREAPWVTAMHEHFGLNGSYRSEDLRRVLGDPRESVEMPTLDPNKPGQSMLLRRG